MARYTTILAVSTLLVGFASTLDVRAQSIYGGQTSAGQTLSSKTLRVLNFYGATAQATAPLNQIPKRPASPPVRRRLPKDKPFSAESNRPAVSPYLNIFRENDLDSAPNYYAFVQPQIQQQQFVQQQRLATQRLRRQVQQASLNLGFSPAGTRGLPTTGHSTRFMSIGGYYAVPR